MSSVFEVLPATTSSSFIPLSRLSFCGLLKQVDQPEQHSINAGEESVEENAHEENVTTDQKDLEQIMHHTDQKDMTTKRSSKRVSRPCPFCDQSLLDLRRHFITTHKNHEKVQAILVDEANGKISTKERVREFAKLRKEGIRKKNLLILAGNGSQLHGERRCKGDKLMCSACNGFFKKQFFYRHRKQCANSSKVEVTSDNCTVSMASSGDKEWEGVLTGMRRDSRYTIIVEDEIIQIIGQDIYAAKKVNKRREAKVKARRAMRRVARLKETLQVTSARELFMIENLRDLEAALQQMCTVEKEMKAGLKVALGTLIKQCCNILVDYYATGGQKEIADKIREFREVFSSPIHYAKLMTTAEYKLKENRQRQNRKPSQLPDEDNLAKLMQYIDKELTNISTITSTRSFVQLRKVTLACITLLNARRGSEAARLLVSDWHERHSWINQLNLTSSDRELLKKYSVAFVMGKGDQLLPVFFPAKCEAALNMLADGTIRQEAGVSASNRFLFAYTGASEDGAIGYNDIKDLCDQLAITTITATRMRHRASTALWAMSVTDEEIDCFMEHIGHQKNIDKNVYACPPALKALKTVTPLLEEINKVPCQDKQHKLKAQLPESILDTDEDNNKKKKRARLDDREGRLVASCRSYTRWSQDATAEIQTVFKDHITAKKTVYPGKDEILTFKNSTTNEQIQKMDWIKIKTKIINETVKAQILLKKVEY